MSESLLHPYEAQPPRAFWSRAVSGGAAEGLAALYRPEVRFGRRARIATAGSCFARHLTAALREAGAILQDAEPAPAAMPRMVAEAYGYGLTSGRWGAIYTARAMAQLLRDIAEGEVSEAHVWARGRRYVDAFRPAVEPDGLATKDEVLVHRDYHLERCSQMLQHTDVFIFTLGLTEAWEEARSGRVFPSCPGVLAGAFNPRIHRLANFRYGEVLADLKTIRATLKRFNPGMQLILSVSPVPLVATAEDTHVLTANAQSKATLRAAAGDFARDHADVDYMPAYELITSPAYGGPYFAADGRSVTPEGIGQVIGLFLGAQGFAAAGLEEVGIHDSDEVSCEEDLVEAFAR